MNKKNLKEVKKLLVVVDMVNGFVREGAMANQNIEHIVGEVENLVNRFTESNDGLVAFVKDAHSEESKEFKQYVAHCIKGTKESENIDELKKYEKMALIHEKNSTSAIFSKDFLKNIDKMKKLEEVVVVGCCTDICVINLAIPLKNYFNEKDRDVSIIVPTNAVETFDLPGHKAEEWNIKAFEFMNQAGIKLVKKYERV